jgi:hypothetical protein
MPSSFEMPPHTWNHHLVCLSHPCGHQWFLNVFSPSVICTGWYLLLLEERPSFKCCKRSSAYRFSFLALYPHLFISTSNSIPRQISFLRVPLPSSTDLPTGCFLFWKHFILLATSTSPFTWRSFSPAGLPYPPRGMGLKFLVCPSHRTPSP